MRKLPVLFCLAVLGWLSLANAAEPPPASGERFLFREPEARSYVLEPSSQISLFSVKDGPEWLEARHERGAGSSILFGKRVVLQFAAETDVYALIAGQPLRLARRLGVGLVILEAPDALTAMRQAQRLAARTGVMASYPVKRRRVARHGAYASKPNDTYFPRQWHLENRDPNTGRPTGADLNVRGAWAYTRGENVTIAIADDGVEYTHPDLARRADGNPHYNFVTGEAGNGLPLDAFQIHATAVAGLAAAEGGNHRGIAGVAPAAGLASWVIFGQNNLLADEEQLMDMFQYRSNVVSVQNHSWGNADVQQLQPELIERTGLSNAFTFGREGRGVLMTRSAGNGREELQNSNDDGYASDPRAIAVSAVRFDGRVASYSTPGACILVAAPSGDDEAGFANLATTDRQGTLGYNREFSTDDQSDYAFDANGFIGTSGSAPQIAGVCALLLSANPELHIRDVQQILALSSRHFDRADPAMHTNGAGFLISHNVGFGVPDAARAVELARQWNRRPPATQAILTTTNPVAIPEDAYRVALSGPGAPTNFVSLIGAPMVGLHPDDPTPVLSLVHVGQATNPITTNLTNKAALIQRGVNFFSDKLAFAAAAGASFAIVYNNADGDERIQMGGTDFTTIPALLISQNDGERLRSLLESGAEIFAQLRTEPAVTTFTVTNTLICEHVGLRIKTDHQSRGDLRITLRSPRGTLSVLQEYNNDRFSDLLDWTYYTTHNFFESSAGEWQVFFTDDRDGTTGSALDVSLIINGVPIEDGDRDGLDDAWEQSRLRTLAFGPNEDPDGDGYSNAREQVMATDPLAGNPPFEVAVSAWNEHLVRLGWPGNTNTTYDVLAASDPKQPPVVVTNLIGRFPETEWFVAQTNGARQFFRLRTVQGN